jgi:prepilin-type N-terminal cleavage/methylation domain-containing protein/prepilin-type processing-associated H-X9-DG protein
LRFYNDGAPVGSAAATIPLSAVSNNLAYFGRSLYPDPFLLGPIDEFQICNHALSDTDVAESFRLGPDIIPEPAQTTQTDAVGYANRKTTMPMIRSHERKTAFTLIELLVVISIIALLIALLLPALTRARETSLRAACASNVRGTGAANINYAVDHDGLFVVIGVSGSTDPDESYGGNWLWDLSITSADELIYYGSGRDILFCPSNDEQKADEHWYYSSAFRVTSYFYLNERQTGPMAHYNFLDYPDDEYEFEQVDRLNNPGGAKQPLITDANLSSPSGNFGYIVGGSPIPHRSNHINGDEPDGGNYFYLDGHATWRQFDTMRIRYRPHNQFF